MITRLVLMLQTEQQSDEITELRARIAAQEAELNARSPVRPAQPRTTSIPSTNSVDTTGPVLAQIRPMKSVSPEEVSASSTARETARRPQADQTPRPAQPTRREAPVASASAPQEPDFSPEQIGSFIQNIKGQYDEYSQDPPVDVKRKQDEGDRHDPFMEELKHYNTPSQPPTAEISKREDDESGRQQSRPDVIGSTSKEHGGVTQGMKDTYEDYSNGKSRSRLERDTNAMAYVRQMVALMLRAR